MYIYFKEKLNQQERDSNPQLASIIVTELRSNNRAIKHDSTEIAVVIVSLFERYLIV